MAPDQMVKVSPTGIWAWALTCQGGFLVMLVRVYGFRPSVEAAVTFRALCEPLMSIRLHVNIDVLLTWGGHCRLLKFIEPYNEGPE